MQILGHLYDLQIKLIDEIIVRPRVDPFACVCVMSASTGIAEIFEKAAQRWPDDTRIMRAHLDIVIHITQVLKELALNVAKE